MAQNPLTKIMRNTSRALNRPNLFLRSVSAESLLEDFLVSAVATVLVIRLYLSLTGYPQLKLGQLHIAHTLFGGALMLIALVILLAFIGHHSRTIAAVLGGIGFGMFIDELGKFVTTDNDYFFRPTIAIIYIIFVIIFFGIRALGDRRTLSSRECLANVFDIAAKGSISGLEKEEKTNALKLLANCDSGPVRDNLNLIIQNTPVSVSRRSKPLKGISRRLSVFYKWAVTKWWFSGIIILFFAFTAVAPVYTVIAVEDLPWGVSLWVTAGVIMVIAFIWSRRARTKYFNSIISVTIVLFSIFMSWAIVSHLNGIPFSIMGWAQFVFPGISGMFISIGILILPRSRLKAYRMFRRAILVSIFFTQVLSFYDHQLIALLGLLANILILIALRYLIKYENVKAKSQFSS